MDINKTIIIGNLTRDPEFKTTQTGKQMTRFSIASNRNFKNASGEKQQETTFVNIVSWGKQAEICSKFLSKGSKVAVVGRIATREYQADDGQKKKVFEIVAEDVQFLTPKGQSGGSQGGDNSSYDDAGEDF